jgi:hypothetical protein
MIEELTTNTNAFCVSLEKLASHAERNVKEIIRKSCIDLFSRIIEYTPKETGRARTNWSIDTQFHKGTTERTDYETRKAEQIAQFSFAIVDQQIIIYNNLEYIEALENGHSQQAPTGMVSLSLAEFQAHFDNEIRKFEEFKPL